MTSPGGLNPQLMHPAGLGKQPQQRSIRRLLIAYDLNTCFGEFGVGVCLGSDFGLGLIRYLSQPIGPAVGFGGELARNDGQILFVDFSTYELLTEQTRGAFTQCDQNNATDRTIQAVGNREIVASRCELLSQPPLKTVAGLGRLRQQAGGFVDGHDRLTIPQDFNGRGCDATDSQVTVSGANLRFARCGRLVPAVDSFDTIGA